MEEMDTTPKNNLKGMILGIGSIKGIYCLILMFSLEQAIYTHTGQTTAPLNRYTHVSCDNESLW